VKGTQIHLGNLLHNPGWRFGVKAYDDFVAKVVGYGRNIEGIARTIIETSLTKKYQRINQQLIPQLRKDEYVDGVILAACQHTANRWGQTHVSTIMKVLAPFNLSQNMVQRRLRGLCEAGKLKAIELQAGLDNIYV
jgi:hypothetical protein